MKETPKATGPTPAQLVAFLEAYFDRRQTMKGSTRAVIDHFKCSRSARTHSYRRLAQVGGDLLARFKRIGGVVTKDMDAAIISKPPPPPVKWSTDVLRSTTEDMWKPWDGRRPDLTWRPDEHASPYDSPQQASPYD